MSDRTGEREIGRERNREREIKNDNQEETGGYSEGVPPLPIPNREVKPLSADGTAKVGE